MYRLYVLVFVFSVQCIVNERFSLAERLVFHWRCVSKGVALSLFLLSLKYSVLMLIEEAEFDRHLR